MKDVTKLGYIADIYDGPHATPKKIENGKYFLSISSLDNGSLDLSKSAFISDKDFIKWTKRVQPQKGDLLFSYETRLGEAALMPDNLQACLGRRMGLLRPKEDKVIPQYLLFAYLSPEFQKVIRKNTIKGATVDRIALNELGNFPIYIPDLKTQQSIAAVLSALDKKIALNKQINARLEEMAKTLYDYWFVQFDFPDANGKPYKSSGGEMVFDETLKREIPKGWEVKSLGEVVTHSTTGLNPRDNFSLGNGENFYVTIKNIKDNEIKFHTCAKITDEALNVINKRSKLDKGDILFTSIEPIGSTYLLHEKPKNWDINESVFSIRSKSDFITPYFLFMLLSSDEIKSFTRQVSTGSVHKGIRHESLKRFTFAYSGIDLIKNFTNLISPMQQNIFFLQKQNHHLTQLRDFLLPMLMNGQVSVTCRGARDG